MSSENIVSKKFRILVDAKNRVYNLISFYTRAVDVFFNSGKNAQDTLGNIYGISDSLTSTSSNIALLKYISKSLLFVPNTKLPLIYKVVDTAANPIASINNETNKNFLFFMVSPYYYFNIN